MHSAGLAAPADQNLGLDDHSAGAGIEKARRRGPDFGDRARKFPGRNRQALGYQERLCVGFLNLHAVQLPIS
jgi:hypothetical protein